MKPLSPELVNILVALSLIGAAYLLWSTIKTARTLHVRTGWNTVGSILLVSMLVEIPLTLVAGGGLIAAKHAAEPLRAGLTLAVALAASVAWFLVLWLALRVTRLWADVGSTWKTMVVMRFKFGGVLAAILLALSIVAIAKLPVLKGQGWSDADARIRQQAITFGIYFVLALVVSLVPMLLRALEKLGFAAFVSARHMRARKSGVLSLISFLAIAAVFLASGGLTIVSSVMGGFTAELKRKILGSSAHILVDTVEQTPWDTYEPILDRVRALPGVQGAMPVVRGEGMLSSPYNRAGVVVRGIDPRAATNVLELASIMEVGQFSYLSDPEAVRSLPADEIIGLGPEGQPYRKGPSLDPALDDLDPAVKAVIDTRPPPRPSVIVGRELAKSLHLFVGDEVSLVTPLGELGPTGFLPKILKLRVAGIYYSGYYEFDASHVYMMMGVAQSYFDVGSKIHAIEVKTKDAEDVGATTPKIAAALGRKDLRVRDWREMNRSLFAALKLERIVVFVLIAIALFVSGFCIVSILSLMVTEKSREIAVLKSLGSTDRLVLRIFFTEGIIVATVGTFVGMLVGLACCAGLSWFGWKFDPKLSYIERLPVAFNPVDYVLVAVASILISSIASIVPAWSASRVRPVESLHGA